MSVSSHPAKVPIIIGSKIGEFRLYASYTCYHSRDSGNILRKDRNDNSDRFTETSERKDGVRKGNDIRVNTPLTLHDTFILSKLQCRRIGYFHTKMQKWVEALELRSAIGAGLLCARGCRRVSASAEDRQDQSSPVTTTAKDHLISMLWSTITILLCLCTLSTCKEHPQHPLFDESSLSKPDKYLARAEKLMKTTPMIDGHNVLSAHRTIVNFRIYQCYSAF